MHEPEPVLSTDIANSNVHVGFCLKKYLKYFLFIGIPIIMTTLITVVSTEFLTTTIIPISLPEINTSSSPPLTADIIVGILMVLVSILCVIPNIIVINAIHSDKELYRLNAYKFMLYLAYFDTLQLIPHTVTGVFNIFQTTFSLTFAKLMGAIVTPCYVAYAVLIVILSFNQLTQLCFPRIDEIIFSKKATKIWVAFCVLLYFLFTIALATPVATIRFYPKIWSWAYDLSYFGSEYVHKTAMIIELAGIPIAGIIYLAIFGVLIAKRKKYKVSKNYQAEMKILIQAGVITCYCSILNVFWHFGDVLLPNTIICYSILNFMWIINCAVNPIIYIIVNGAIRKNTKLKKNRISGAILIGQHQTAIRTISNPCDDPATTYPAAVPRQSLSRSQTPVI